MSFELHPQLVGDCIHIVDLELCRVLLMNESRYPWFILVPMRDGLRELMELTSDESAIYWGESNMLQSFLRDVFKAEKLNVAALGNMVPQLHMHHIARFQHDAAWPAPVWGKFPPEPYPAETIEQLKTQLLQYIGELNS